MFHENVQVFNTDSLTKCCALLLRFAASASGLYYLWMVSLFFGEIRGISECLVVLAKVLAKGKLSSAYFEGKDSRSDVYLVFSVYFFLVSLTNLEGASTYQHGASQARSCLSRSATAAALEYCSNSTFVVIEWSSVRIWKFDSNRTESCRWKLWRSW